MLKVQGMIHFVFKAQRIKGFAQEIYLKKIGSIIQQEKEKWPISSVACK